MTEPRTPEPGAVDGAGAVAPGGHVEPTRAAGTVLWRDGAHGREVALIHRPWRDDWSLPKGKLGSGEHTLAAAVRETIEETGQTPVLGRRLPTRRYLRDGWPKRVAWWAATPVGEAPFTPGDEVDAMEWLPLPRARERLTYDHDRRVLDDFRAGPARTVPVIVLRHATAGDKHSWVGDDLLRPLDETGRADAAGLAPLLRAFRVPRVVSSAAARCVETVLPYAAAYDVQVRTERAFTVGAAHAGKDPFDRPAARAAFAALLAGRGPVAVCTHGELVPELMRAALPPLGAPGPRQLALDKGAFWVLHVRAEDGALAALERHAVRG